MLLDVMGCYALIDEMAILLGGHAAKPENVMKLLGTVSSLWSDSTHSEVKRGNDDPEQVNGDLTFAVNGQPQVVKPIFSDATWREQGTIPRFLVCEPEPRKCKRVKGETINPKDKATIDQFNAITSRIFDVTPCQEGKYTVTADEHAEEVLTDFYNEMQEKSETVYAEIESYALRATEHAGRLSGLLALYRTYYDSEPMQTPKGDITMTEADALGGVTLMRYYLHEYNRLSTGDFGADINPFIHTH